MIKPDLSAFAVAKALQMKDWGIVREARAAGLPWDQLVSQQGYRALHWAILQKDAAAVDRLLEQESPTGPYLYHSQVRSPLWDALWSRQDAIVASLIQGGADPGEPSPLDPTRLPLIEASQKWLTQATQALLQQGPALYLLPLAAQLKVLHDWGRALASAEPKSAQAVLTQIQDSGWVPPFTSPEWPALVSQLTELSLAAASRQFLEGWLARWRQLALMQTPAPSEGHPRPRS